MPTKKYYQNPVDEYIKPIEGMNEKEIISYPAFSLVPKEQLKDPNVQLPYDVNPLDWKTGDTATDQERQQRKMVRNYAQQLYEEKAKTGDIEEARKKAARATNIANAGQGLEQMFKSRSVAAGGPGVDTGYWNEMRGQAKEGVANAELDRKRQIEDYLTKKKLGSEAVTEQQQMKELDLANKMADPQSEISKQYQHFFINAYGDKYGDFINEQTGERYGGVKNMSANDIMQASKLLEPRAKMDLTREIETARLGANSEENPKTQAEINQINARTKQIEAATKAEQAKAEKPVTSKAYEAVDRDYAKQYNDWTTTGRASYLKNRQLLEDAKNSLSNLSGGEKSSVSGKGTSFFGKITGDFSRSEKSLQLENDVKQAAQSSLKAILGGTYTAGEGESVMNKAYDVRLPPEQNIKKIQRALDELDERAKAEEKKAKHFEKWKTLEGWESSYQNEHDKALEWARKNSDDPRAKAILNLRGGQ